MNKIRCLAVDDEPLALRQVAGYIEKVPFFELVAQCQSALEALHVMEKEHIDAIFVDINMPDLNGMDFVRSLAVPPITVFTTAYADYAIEGYKVNALDYLLKPFSFDDFHRVALKVRKQYTLENANEQALNKDTDDTIFLKSGHQVIRISISDILYVEGMSEYLKIHLSSRARSIIILFGMKRFEEALPSFFMRIHRSYIINLRKIREVNKNRVILEQDINLPVGDLYRNTFNDYLARKFFGR